MTDIFSTTITFPEVQRSVKATQVALGAGAGGYPFTPDLETGSSYLVVDFIG